MEDMKTLSVNPRVCGWVCFSHTPVRRNRKKDKKCRETHTQRRRGTEGERNWATKEVKERVL